MVLRAAELWPILACAPLVGLAKAGIPGLGILPAALLALMLPVKASIGTTLALLIVGDLGAVAAWRGTVDRDRLPPLLAWSLVGLAAGWWALAAGSDRAVRLMVGTVLLALIALQALRRWGPRRLPTAPLPFMAMSAGFSTMTANAAGPIIALHLLAAGLDRQRIVGTCAWYFLIINLIKLPVALHLGMLDLMALAQVALVAPLVLAGSWAGRWLCQALDPLRFELAVLLLSTVGAVALLVR